MLGAMRERVRKTSRKVNICMHLKVFLHVCVCYIERPSHIQIQKLVKNQINDVTHRIDRVKLCRGVAWRAVSRGIK